MKDKLAENINNETKFNFKYGPIKNVINPTNKLKNKGMNIIAKGIKILKFSSNVREFAIQEIPLK